MNAAPALWTAEEAVAATGGHTAVAWEAAGISIDSRTLESGDLFVALKGPNFDGHAFLADAFRRGAAAAMVEVPPNGIDATSPVLVVPDSLTALGDMGAAARRRTGARIIAVTGSVGKTGTKEALKLVLSGQGAVSANTGSLNNHWGLPLSLARMPADTAFGVFEIGMNHAGEIDPLSRLARPHVAVVTAVEAVHSAYFESVEAIADAKAEIFAGIEPGGVAVLNRDNPHFDRLAAAAAAAGVDTVLGFGADPAAAVRLLEVDPDSHGSRVSADIAGEAVTYRVGVAGHHWVMNSLAVLAAVVAAGGEVRPAALALEGLKAPEGRGRRLTVAVADGHFELIDDSYNASPSSMRAAFEVLGRVRPCPGGRRIAVLGDMLELGDDAQALHAALAEPLEECAIDLVFTAGPGMGALWDALPRYMRGGHAADSDKLAPIVATAVRPGDVVTVKGSAASRMGLVVRALHALDNEEAAPQRAANDK